MLTSRLLQADEHNRFITFTQESKDLFTQQNNGAPVDPAHLRAYLQNAVVRIFTRPNSPGRWVAGYAINVQPPFRYLSVLPSEVGDDLLREHNLVQTDLVEITLLIRARDINWLPGERELYYLNSLADALRTGRRVVLGGSVKESHKQTQMEILDQLLFKGYLDFSGTPIYGWLYYATRWGVVRNVFHHLLKLLRSGLGTPRKPSKPKPNRQPTDSLPNNQ